MNGDIQPADVYARVGFMLWVLYTLCVLVVLQIAVKVVIFGRVVGLLERTDRLLKMAEEHGSVTDHQRERIDQAIGEAAASGSHPKPWKPGDPDRRQAPGG